MEKWISESSAWHQRRRFMTFLEHLYADLHIGRPCSKSTESWSKKDTNISDINREVDPVEDVVDDTAGRH